jgi:hypothetical protein
MMRGDVGAGGRMDLSGLPVEDGFRLRGVQVTRVETFVDAAFAFSLTLLVIFFNELPDTVAELRDALRRVPTFAVCFVLLALFWSAHNRWSRRFGLDDTRSTVLSLALVLVVLVFVYPLRMVTSSALSLLSGGWVPNELGGLGENWLLDLQTVFMVYALGFGLMSWLTWQLNAHALRRGAELGLDARERYDTVSEIGIHRIMTGAALASVALSGAVLAWPPGFGWRALVGAPMWAYAAMGAAIGMYATRRHRRRAARLEAAA